jgi:hypothetical protein
MDCLTLHQGVPICYTDKGACTDGQPSSIDQNYDWSYAACAWAGGGGGGVPVTGQQFIINGVITNSNTNHAAGLPPATITLDTTTTQAQ